MKRIILMCMLTLLSACGNDSSVQETSSVTSTSSFPTGLAVSSPLDVANGTSSPKTSTKLYKIGAGKTSRYNWATTIVSDILEGTDPEHCTFDPDLFLTHNIDAACYGPEVDYVNHPDDMSTGSGSLPTGDTGIWVETDSSTGNACTADELNARMEGVRDRSLASLMSLAAMVCTINSSGGTLSLPDSATTSLDLTASMPAVTGVTYNSATMSYSTTTASEDKYSYALNIDYNGKNIIVEMAHIPGSAITDYRGQFTYMISDTFSGGNCPTSDVTHNGSFVYNRPSSSNMSVELREAMFCGSGSNGLNSSKRVDDDKKYSASTEPAGWGNNFSVLSADYNPTTQTGDYAYAWQAGPNDGTTRVFNLLVTEDTDDSSEDLEVTSFFGFGPDIDTLNPSISGFICNWAGPSNSHTLKELAQKQVVSFNSTTRKFDSVSANIIYAPTNSCDYDGLGTFTYDSDADGLTDTDTAVAITNNLVTGTDDGTGTLTIEQTISDANITVPALPVACSECAP